jgi:hypothetical protein
MRKNKKNCMKITIQQMNKYKRFCQDEEGSKPSLWEHGWIDMTRLNEYSVEGKTDTMGVT